MNKEQLASLFRSLVQMVCAGLTAKGILAPEDSTSILASAEVALPALVAAGVTIYGSIIKRSDKNLVKAANEVTGKKLGGSDARVRN